MRQLKRAKRLKIDGWFIDRLIGILRDNGGELSTRALSQNYGIKAKAVREAACRYPNVFQLNLVRGRLPNWVRLMIPVQEHRIEASGIEVGP
jgi:hypothetical protein